MCTDPGRDGLKYIFLDEGQTLPQVTPMISQALPPLLPWVVPSPAWFLVITSNGIGAPCPVLPMRICRGGDEIFPWSG